MDFGDAKKMMQLQQEAMKVKKELENTLIEAEIEGVFITVNGEMKVEKTDFETSNLIPGLDGSQKENLEKAIMDAVNKGMKKAQEVAAKKMQGVMGQMGMNMPAGGGLPGGM